MNALFFPMHVFFFCGSHPDLWHAIGHLSQLSGVQLGLWTHAICNTLHNNLDFNEFTIGKKKCMR